MSGPFGEGGGAIFRRRRLRDQRTEGSTTAAPASTLKGVWLPRGFARRARVLPSTHSLSILSPPFLYIHTRSLSLTLDSFALSLIFE
jgi:hypothetical protein